jgi:hypothetical protein
MLPQLMRTGPSRLPEAETRSKLSRHLPDTRWLGGAML